jgi:hypothetical protein
MTLVTRTRLVFEKWGGHPHWEAAALHLGHDEHGTWLGLPLGSTFSRPGARFETTELQVTLVPDAPFVATFYAPGGSAPCDVYVDISTVPERGISCVRAVDLDLDVLRGWSGRVWVDDEDEFAEHRKRFGYPDDVAALAVASCDQVRGAVAAGRPPFDGTAARWMRQLEEVTGLR